MSNSSHPGLEEGQSIITIYATGSFDAESDTHITESLLESRTKLSTDTGYVMKFGDETHRDLTPFDVASLGTVMAYPLPASALDSLPAFIRNELEYLHAVQLLAAYDRENRIFLNPRLARDTHQYLHRFVELLTSELTVHEAVDWLIVAETEQYTLNQWARIRSVTPDAIRSNITDARTKLNRNLPGTQTSTPASQH